MSPLSGKNLVFLPGLDGTGISFEPLGQWLPPDVRVTVVRYPTDRLLDLDQTVECAASQIDPGREAIVVAESFSGPTAIVLAASGRIKARALILCATFARSPRPALLRWSKHLPLARLFKVPWPRPFLSLVVAGGRANAQILRSLQQRVRSVVPTRVLAHRLDVIHRLDVRPWLPRLTMPCLYIQATGDRTVPASALEDFCTGIARLKVARIKGPHFILQARPRQALDAMEAFLIHPTERKEAP